MAYWIGHLISGSQNGTRTTDNIDLVYEMVLHKYG